MTTTTVTRQGQWPPAHIVRCEECRKPAGADPRGAVYSHDASCTVGRAALAAHADKRAAQ